MTPARHGHTAVGPCRPSRARTVLAAAALALLCILATACAQPVAGIWPPRLGDVTHRIIVSTDEWHSVIGLRTGVPGKPLEEWGYADKKYFFEGDDDSCGALDALFLPGPGVLEVTHADLPLGLRTQHPPGRTWAFDLTGAGHAELLAFLRGDIASPGTISQAGGSDWFDSNSTYHGFHHCHHWTAEALRAAGLPIQPSFALFKCWFESQLDRAKRIAEEAPRAGGTAP